ncbi:MAG: pyrroline-5-carboxylate reductase [Mucinivorans sp.]
MKITIIGAGNMGGAIARGLLAQPDFNPSDLMIAKFAPAAADTTFAALGCRTTTDAREACAGADVIIVAVKPWIFEHVARQIKPFVASAAVVSVVGGVRLVNLSDHFSSAIFRAVPNTAASVGESITFMCSEQATAEQRQMVEQLFTSVGSVTWLDESLFEAATALGSCGIAFAMRYIRASIEGAVEMGLTSTLAQKIVAQTLIGAATIIKNNPTAHPEAEVDRVTTAGGITIRGLNAMEDRGFTPSVVAGLKACKSIK